jgi:hypothetical protein
LESYQSIFNLLYAKGEIWLNLWSLHLLWSYSFPYFLLKRTMIVSNIFFHSFKICHFNSYMISFLCYLFFLFQNILNVIKTLYVKKKLSVKLLRFHSVEITNVFVLPQINQKIIGVQDQRTCRVEWFLSLD